MTEMYPPRHVLEDYQGLDKYSTKTEYFIEPRGIGLYGIVFYPKIKFNKIQVEVLKQLYSAFETLNVRVSEDGGVVVEVPLGQKFGWILGRVAIFYRLAAKAGEVV